jgi:putative inorganic carbon (hco3(-)) transporter
MPVVSLKYFLARLWFLASFYFLASQIFRRFPQIIRFYWLYIIPLIIVIFYTIYQHSKFGLMEQEAANWVVKPFYNDHTSYGAMLAMYLPVIIGFLLSHRLKFRMKMLVAVVLTIFIVALIFSYTRAAWLSLAATFIVFLLVLFRIKFRTVLIGAGVLVAVFFVFRTQVFISLEQNRQDASSDMLKQIQSISNISTDASNLERINRWNCAIRMFQEKPVFGWGPGTYMFKYAPFQFSYEKTIISTNAGTGGNAHSEYIGPLAESGVMGSLTFIAIVIATVWTALRVYKNSRSREVKILTMTSLLGLFTYFFHGTLNNFLDTDKASAPFWGFIAIIVTFDLYYRDQTDKEIIQNKPEEKVN